MRETVKIFVDAVKETPRLYFAPFFAALHAVRAVEQDMLHVPSTKTSLKVRTFDKAPAHLGSKRPAAKKVVKKAFGKKR